MGEFVVRGLRRFLRENGADGVCFWWGLVWGEGAELRVLEFHKASCWGLLLRCGVSVVLQSLTP